MANKRIYLSSPTMHGEEQEFIKEAFDTNWVAPLGPNVNNFEKEMCDYTGAAHACALSAGTAAIHLALKIIGVGQGDIVFTSSLTFAATCNPITYEKATPVFIDSEEDTWNISPEALKKAYEKYPNPKAIVYAHLYGTPAKIDEIMEIAAAHGTPVIEDAAEGFGSKFNGKVLGTFGKFGVLSFNGNKMITTSGGGALICENAEDKNTIMWYATQAREAYPYYQHEAIGYNYRMSNICAGIGRGQMTVADAHIAHHKHIQHLYEELLGEVSGITVHSQPDDAVYDSNYWLCTIVLDSNVQIKGQENAYKKAITTAVGGAAGVIHASGGLHTDCEPNDNVEALRIFMDEAQVEARPVWKPMHCQPVYKHCPAYLNGVSESIFKKSLCLPAGPCVSDADVHYIVDKIKEAIVF